MSTATITACFTGLVRAIGMLLTAIVLAEFIYFLLFSEKSEEVTGNNDCNPYRFENATKPTAKALGFIFFIYPGNHQSFTRRHMAAQEDLFAGGAMQKIKTCL
jgi:hypothetical protein